MTEINLIKEKTRKLLKIKKRSLETDTLIQEVLNSIIIHKEYKNNLMVKYLLILFERTKSQDIKRDIFIELKKIKIKSEKLKVIYELIRSEMEGTDFKESILHLNEELKRKILNKMKKREY